MKVFLTGAGGFIGSVVAEKLKGRGFKVSALARGEIAEARLRGKNFEIVSGGLENADVLRRAAAEADAVIHTAFSHHSDDYDEAVKLDRAAIEAFADALQDTNKPLIVTSSSAVLGDTRGMAADEDHPFDENSSRRSRGESERDALRLSSKGIRSVVIRLPLFVYGRAGSSFVPFLIEQAKSAGAANYIDAGGQRVSALHVEDAADLYLLALETSTAKGLYNASAETVSMRELSEAIARLLDVKAKSITADEARRQFGKMFEFLSINNELDAAKARRELGWSPQSYNSVLDDIENGSYRKYRE
jgi:nucleoside-diphosphate-sugar epimerase